MSYYIIHPKHLAALRVTSSSDACLPHICGIAVERHAEGATFISTDGYRMGVIDRPSAGASCGDTFIIPNAAVDQMLREAAAVQKEHKKVGIALAVSDREWNIIEYPATTVLERLSGAGVFAKGEFKAVDGTFPDWRRTLFSPAVPAPTVGPIGANAAYLGDIAKIARALGGTKFCAASIYPLNGVHHPLEITFPAFPRYFGVLMPVWL